MEDGEESIDGEWFRAEELLTVEVFGLAVFVGNAKGGFGRATTSGAASTASSGTELATAFEGFALRGTAREAERESSRRKYRTSSRDGLYEAKKDAMTKKVV